MSNETEAKLISKISEQALELARLNAEKEIQLRERQNSSNQSNSLSLVAQKRRIELQHRDQLDALQKQLNTANSRLEENAKIRNQQIVDIESLTREARFFKKRSSDQERELQNLRGELDSLSGLLADSKSYDKNTLQKAKSMRDLITQYEKKQTDSNNTIDELNMKVHVLEEALEFRADDIGLSGHADLLAKIARMRGEVTALRNEIMSKKDIIENVESEKQKVFQENRNLTEEICSIRERLAAAKQNVKLMEAGNLVEKLHAVEQERNILVEFIEADMEKSASISKDRDEVASSLRVAQRNIAILDSRVKSQEAELNTSNNERDKLEKELNDTCIQLNEARRTLALVESQKDDLDHRLHRKELEVEELCKMEVSLYAQVREKDTKTEETEKALHTTRSKCKEFESLMESSKTQVTILQDRVYSLEKDNNILRTDLSQTQMKLYQLEPLCKSLQEEKVKWMNISGEVEKMRSIFEAVKDLNRELKSSEEEKSFPSSSLTQQHARWCSLPSLRQISSSLYDRIVRLFQDMHGKELEASESKSIIENLQQEIQAMERDRNSAHARDSERSYGLELETKDLREKLEITENQLASYREVKIILDQIHTVMKTAAATTLYSLNHAYMGDNSKGKNIRQTHNHVDRAFNRNRLDENVDNSTELQPVELCLEDIIDGSSKWDEHEKVYQERGSHRNHQIPNINYNDYNLCDDRELPGLVSRTLTYNAEAVNRLEECKHTLQELQNEYRDLKEQQEHVFYENQRLSNALENLHERGNRQNEEQEEHERKIEMELNNAAELVERQNAIIATTDLKLAEVSKSNVLLNAQITSHEQRAGVLRKKMLHVVTSFAQSSCIPLTLKAPDSSADVMDILDIASSYYTDILQYEKYNLKLTRSLDIHTTGLLSQEDVRMLGLNVSRSRPTDTLRNISTIQLNQYSNGSQTNAENVNGVSNRSHMTGYGVGVSGSEGGPEKRHVSSSNISINLKDLRFGTSASKNVPSDDRDSINQKSTPFDEKRLDAILSKTHFHTNSSEELQEMTRRDILQIKVKQAHSRFASIQEPSEY